MRVRRGAGIDLRSAGARERGQGKKKARFFVCAALLLAMIAASALAWEPNTEPQMLESFQERIEVAPHYSDKGYLLWYDAALHEPLPEDGSEPKIPSAGIPRHERGQLRRAHVANAGEL